MSRVNSLSQYQTKMSNQSQRTTAFSQSTATPLSRSNQISNIIECPICSESIRQSHMCPSCCKLFCESCIKNQIKNKKAQCPSCLKPLNVSNLLNCSMLGRQIEQALSKSVSKIKTPLVSTSIMMSPSGTKILFPKLPGQVYESTPIRNTEVLCQKHQMKLDYFCQKCSIGLCSDCAVLSSDHLGHNICKISSKKLKFKQILTSLQKNLVLIKQKTTKLFNQANTTMKNSKSLQGRKFNILNAHLSQIYDKQIQKINTQIKQKQQIFQIRLKNYQKFQDKFNQTLNTIQNATKSKIVKNSTKIQKQIQQFLKITIQQPIIPQISLQNSIIPYYQQKTYILDNYNYLRHKGDVLISQPLFCKGTQWRLKIFPGGINYMNPVNKGLDQYLAIHIQLSRGYQYSNLYRFRIQLVNQANRTKCLSYQYQNYFKPGQSWCIDNFIQIPTLYEQNFINFQLGHIQIVLYIRCVTYYHAIKDQKAFITTKQIKITQNNNKIKILQQKAIEKGINIQILNKQKDKQSQQNLVKIKEKNVIQSSSRAIDQQE